MSSNLHITHEMASEARSILSAAKLTEDGTESGNDSNTLQSVFVTVFFPIFCKLTSKRKFTNPTKMEENVAIERPKHSSLDSPCVQFRPTSTCTRAPHRKRHWVERSVVAFPFPSRTVHSPWRSCGFVPRVDQMRSEPPSRFVTTQSTA